MLSVVMFASSATAAERTWSGATNGLWSVAGNWGGAVPGGADNVIFYAPAAGNLATTVDAGLALSGTLFFNANAASNVTIDLEAALRLGGINIDAGSSGTHSMTSGAGSLTIGANSLASNATADYSFVNNSGKAFAINTNITAATQANTGTNVTRNYNFGGAGDMVVSGNITLAATSATNEVLNVVKSGFGSLSILALGAPQGYNGKTQINGGVLEIAKIANGGGASSIGISSNAASNLVLNSGTLRFTGTSNANGTSDRLFTVGSTASIEASGSGALTLNGSGTLAFTTANVAASLALAGSGTGSFGSAFVLANNGSGGLSLVKDGTGTWTIGNGNNSYSGGTTLNNGVLILGALGTSILGSGTLVINGGTLAPNGTGSRNPNVPILFGGNASLGQVGTTGALQLGGAINLGGSIRTLTVNGPVVCGGTVSNGGLVKLGSGTLTLSSANSYTGATVVSAGTLLINGSLASASAVTVNSGGKLSAALGTTLSNEVTVNQGGRLGGNGTYSDPTGITIGSGAVVAPGNSPGHTTFATDLSLQSAGIYEWELGAYDAASWGVASDLLTVTGAGNELLFDSGSLLTLNFVDGVADPNSAGAGGFWLSDHTWKVAEALAGGVVTDNGLGIQGTSSFTNGSFSLGDRGGELFLDYAAVPEPGTCLLVGGGLGVLLLRRKSGGR